MSNRIAPFGWFGGKQRLAPAIVDMLPPHRMYVEVFGGGAAVLFAKPPTSIEVYNDIDDGLVNFFTVLRDESEELIRRLRLTPYARTEFLDCRSSWPKEKDPVEKARKWFMCTALSFDSVGRSTGWKYTRYTNDNKAPMFVIRVEDLWRHAARLRMVQVDHRKWQECMDLYDADDVVFYCDPPYVPSTRKGGTYRYEMDWSAHKKFLTYVKQCKASVIISGYDSQTYRDMLEPDFERYEFEVALIADNKPDGGERERRIEVIWRRTNDKDLRLFDKLSDLTLQTSTPAT